MVRTKMLAPASKRLGFLLALAWCLAPTLLIGLLLNSSLVANEVARNIGQTLEGPTAPVVEGPTLEEKGWLETAREENVALTGVGPKNAKEERAWFEVFHVTDVRQKSRFRAFIRKQRAQIDQREQALHSVADETATRLAPGVEEIVIERKKKQKRQIDLQQQAAHSVTAEDPVTRSKPSVKEIATERKEEQKGRINPQPQTNHSATEKEIVLERTRTQKEQIDPQQQATHSATAEDTVTRSASGVKERVTEQERKQEGQINQQQQANHSVMETEAATRSAPAVKDMAIVRMKPEELKLPTPIIVMGMMKAGTTSIYSYFKCGMDMNVTKLSHYDCKPGKNPLYTNMACGTKMGRNVGGRQPIFDGVPSFHLYSEIDGNEKEHIHLPQYKHVEEIYAAHPNATWILNLRDPRKWLDSIDRWQGLRQRFIVAQLGPDLPSSLQTGKKKKRVQHTGEKDEDMLNFYTKQAKRVRNFAKNHTSLHFVEVRIDHPNAGQTMEDAFGISRQCWGNKNVNTGDGKWTEH